MWTMLLAQTSQSNGGMSTWGIVEWTAFFGLLTTLVGSITASTIAVMNSRRANAKADTNSTHVQTIAGVQGTMIEGMNANPNLPTFSDETKASIRTIASGE